MSKQSKQERVVIPTERSLNKPDANDLLSQISSNSNQNQNSNNGKNTK
jgi:hypothetical protein